MRKKIIENLSFQELQGFPELFQIISRNFLKLDNNEKISAVYLQSLKYLFVFSTYFQQNFLYHFSIIASVLHKLI